MSGWKKLAAASAAGGAGPDVDEVFSTYLYYGNGSNRNIVNGLDLSGEGGITWVKGRTNAVPHYIANTESGGGGFHHRINDGQNTTTTAGITGFNNNGFSLGTATDFNYNNATYGHFVSWSFRNHPSFFKVIKYTGNGTSQTINHGLDCDVGAVLVHSEDNNRDGVWWHRELANASNGTGYLLADSNQNETTASLIWNSTAPTSTTVSVGASNLTNSNGEEYIMYVFAHNDGNGVFGQTGDQDIISCGSATFGSSTVTVNLGWEPQFLIVKRYDGYDNWRMVDQMRGWHNEQNISTSIYHKILYPNLSNAEADGSQFYLNSTGFSTNGMTAGDYIYIAIRRGPMVVPEDADDVFAIDLSQSTSISNSWDSGFPVDMAIQREYTGSGDNFIHARLTSTRRLKPNTTAEEQGAFYNTFDSNEGWGSFPYAGATEASWMWRRAPNYFDVVCYAGSATTPRTISHNLGVAPEMIWIKGRDAGGGQWYVYHAAMGNQAYGRLDESGRFLVSSDGSVAQTIWNATDPTESVFSLGNASNGNSNGQKFIAYLFASLDGVSKVGSYTGNGNASQNIDCGFSSGARFVLIKTSSATGSWFWFDTERGIVAGNDSRLELNATSAEVTSADVIDPYSSGFAVTNNSIGINISGREYIFYAIA